jgi:DNA (cytosine-5)-methyltransferase 1
MAAALNLRVLDLFCGEGGAGAGWHRAGFSVFGVDNDAARLSRYPYPHAQGDALEYLLAHGHEFDAIHASPPCTGYTRGTAAVPDRLTRYDRLIAATREALQIVGKPYVIENVADARPELRSPLMLCWSMFYRPGSVRDIDGTPLTMQRHRLFEASFPVLAPGVCSHPRGMQVAGAYGGARRNAAEARHVRKGGYVPPSLAVLRALVDAPWMSERGCFLSIPPAYTQHLGSHLREHLAAA